MSKKDKPHNNPDKHADDPAASSKKTEKAKAELVSEFKQPGSSDQKKLVLVDKKTFVRELRAFKLDWSNCRDGCASRN